MARDAMTMTGPDDLPGLRDIHEAAVRLRGRVHRTPVHTSRMLNERAGRELFLKCENLQRIGAFKIRGAMNAILQLDDDVAARGVVTHSSGNHAQAVALAARERGIPAHIVMPENAPAVKRAAVEGYGATIYPCVPTLVARETTAQDVIERTGATLIHAYDDPRIIAGQGTAALELLDEVGELDAVVTPVGGGGLLAGTCLAVHGVVPHAQVIAGEPAGADDAARSLAAGERIEQTAPNTIADGLLTSLGHRNWAVIRDHVAQVVTVDDDAIRAVMHFVWERMKLIIEPSAAVGVAAVLDPAFPADRRRVGVILSGGNVPIPSIV